MIADVDDGVDKCATEIVLSLPLEFLDRRPQLRDDGFLLGDLCGESLVLGS
ncbi:hypothetical protein R4369_23795 [Rhodococcus opacus]|nr:hypothetical protein [Rhodococcus opacus]